VAAVGTAGRLASADEARQHLEDGGFACVATETGWLALCLVASGRRGELAAYGAVGVAFATWGEARLFVEAGAGANLLADRHLPGPLVLHLEESAPGFLAPAGEGVRVHVPDSKVAHELAGELGPLDCVVVQAQDAGSALRLLDPLACLVVPGVAGTVPATEVDARGALPVVVREGVIPKGQVESAWC
jgi:tRNA A37 threonylcarbamoyladenosine synthetase subunit TsaC/SUA5/YrdC